MHPEYIFRTLYCIFPGNNQIRDHFPEKFVIGFSQNSVSFFKHPNTVSISELPSGS